MTKKEIKELEKDEKYLTEKYTEYQVAIDPGTLLTYEEWKIAFLSGLNAKYN